MSAYLIANIRADDAERYESYVAAVPSLITKHGGVYRVRGGHTQVLEGEWTRPARRSRVSRPRVRARV